MEVLHQPDSNRFTVSVDGYVAYLEYEIKNKEMYLLHTIVPREIGGQGIASLLVKTGIDYARSSGLKPVAVCSYAAAWLERHPE